MSSYIQQANAALAAAINQAFTDGVIGAGLNLPVIAQAVLVPTKDFKNLKSFFKRRKNYV